MPVSTLTISLTPCAGGGFHHFGPHAVAVLQAVRHVIGGDAAGQFDGLRQEDDARWCRPRRNRRRSGSSRARGWPARRRSSAARHVAQQQRIVQIVERRMQEAPRGVRRREIRGAPAPWRPRVRSAARRPSAATVARLARAARQRRRSSAQFLEKYPPSESSSSDRPRRPGALAISSSSVQEFLVPVGLQFVDVEARVVVEGQFQRAGHAFVDAQLAQAGLDSRAARRGAARSSSSCSSRSSISPASNSRRGEEDQLDAGLAGRHPETSGSRDNVRLSQSTMGRPSRPPGAAVEDGKAAATPGSPGFRASVCRDSNPRCCLSLTPTPEYQRDRPGRGRKA